MTFTINNAIETVRSAIDAGEYTAEAQEAMEFLRSKSRFTAEQKVAIAVLTDRAAELLDEEDEAAPQTMAAKLRRAREHYEVAVSASGNKSFYNGDEVALFLEGQPATFAMALADEFTPLADGQLHEDRYASLNEGSKRMNASNKLRGAIRRGDIEFKRNKAGEVTGFKFTS